MSFFCCSPFGDGVPFPVVVRSYKVIQSSEGESWLNGKRVIRAVTESGSPVIWEAEYFGASPETAQLSATMKTLLEPIEHLVHPNHRAHPGLKFQLFLISFTRLLDWWQSGGLAAKSGDLAEIEDKLCSVFRPPNDWLRPPAKPYLPSNSNDGYAFTSRWCEQCQKDSVAGPEGCEILAMALIGEQPDEWLWQEGASAPCCTAFEPKRPKKRKPKEAPGQLALELFS